MVALIYLDISCHVCRVRYDVVEGDSVADLDVFDRNALDIGAGGYIRRNSTNPTQDAILDLENTITDGALSQQSFSRV